MIRRQRVVCVDFVTDKTLISSSQVNYSKDLDEPNKTMKILALLGLLAAAMTFCNLSEKLTKGTDSGPSNSSQPPSNAATKPAPDRESVKNELVKIENDMADAAVEGDITMLSKNTTDDFEQIGVDGKVQNKNEALADVKKEKSIKSWSITEAELVSVTEDSAVLKYVLSLKLKTGQSGKARVTDTFAKKDGRWLLKSSQQTMVK